MLSEDELAQLRGLTSLPGLSWSGSSRSSRLLRRSPGRSAAGTTCWAGLPCWMPPGAQFHLPRRWTTRVAPSSVQNDHFRVQSARSAGSTPAVQIGGYACGLPGDSTAYRDRYPPDGPTPRASTVPSLAGSDVSVLIAGPACKTHGDPTYLIAAIWRLGCGIASGQARSRCPAGCYGCGGPPLSLAWLSHGLLVAGRRARGGSKGPSWS